MGVRLYDPGTGRFWSTDPEPGGNATAYDYCSADPVNCTDLTGRFGFKSLLKKVAKVAEIVSVIPGPVGAVAAGVSAVSYAATGAKGKALQMAAFVAVAAVGAGAAVAAVKTAGAAIKAGRNGLTLAKAAVAARARAKAIDFGVNLVQRSDAAAAKTAFRLGSRGNPRGRILGKIIKKNPDVFGQGVKPLNRGGRIRIGMSETKKGVPRPAIRLPNPGRKSSIHIRLD
jgi:hypothetical protein